MFECNIAEYCSECIGGCDDEETDESIENERMKKAINNFCQLHKNFHPSWLRRSEIKELFDIIKTYEG